MTIIGVCLVILIFIIFLIMNKLDSLDRIPDQSSSYELMINELNKKIPVNNGYTYKIHRLKTSVYNFVVVDVETNGLDGNIIQLSALKFKHDKLVDTFNQFINPGSLPLEADVTYLTGITNAKLVHQKRFDSIKSEFNTFCEDLPFVGHNIIKYDIPHLENECLRHGDYFVIDTLLLSRKKLSYYKCPGFDLPTLEIYFNIKNNSHDALEDCKATAKIYQILRSGRIKSAYLPYLKHEHISIVGTFDWPKREMFIPFINSLGATIKPTVDKDTFCLIKGKTRNITKREEDARKYGIPIYSYKEFILRLGKLIS